MINKKEVQAYLDKSTKRSVSIADRVIEYLFLVAFLFLLCLWWEWESAVPVVRAWQDLWAVCIFLFFSKMLIKVVRYLKSL